MNNRYSSVDRAKEFQSRREIKPLFLSRQKNFNDHRINMIQFFSHTKQNTNRSIVPRKLLPKRLPALNRKILSTYKYDIYTKTSDFSLDTNNNTNSIEKENNYNFNFLNTEINSDKKYRQVINSNFIDRPTLSINHTESSLITDFIKLQTNTRTKSPFTNNPNERLYPKKYKESKNSIYESIKIINEIKSQNPKVKLQNINNNYYKKMPAPTYRSIIAYSKKFENEVFDSSKVINKHKYDDYELQQKENDVKDFIKKNKNIALTNSLVVAMENENKRLQKMKVSRFNDVEKCGKRIITDENDFEQLINDQRDLHFKFITIEEKIFRENAYLKKLLTNYETKSKSLEDEIFKLIEQIEALRIYAKFVHKVLGGEVKIFENQIIPDYENDNRPEITSLINRVYEKYGIFLKEPKSSSNKVNKSNFNTLNSDEKDDEKNINESSKVNSTEDKKEKEEEEEEKEKEKKGKEEMKKEEKEEEEEDKEKEEEEEEKKEEEEEKKKEDEEKKEKEKENEVTEEIDFDFLNYPKLMIKKYIDIEDQILRIIQRRETFYKYYNAEKEENEQIIKDMKHRIQELEKEYSLSKKALMDYKRNEFGDYGNGMTKEEFFIMAHNLCETILNENKNGKSNKNKSKAQTHMSGIEVLELNDDIMKCVDIVTEKEKIINKYMKQIEEYLKIDTKVAEGIIYRRKKENIFEIHNDVKEKLKEEEDKKKFESEERLHKVILKYRKSEPPLYKKKKEVEAKVDINEVIKQENEELLEYQ